MTDETTLQAITLTILGHNVQLRCTADKVELLQQAAEQLNTSAKQLRHSKMLVNPDRLAILAALQLACEQSLTITETHDAQTTLANSLIEKIETVLED